MHIHWLQHVPFEGLGTIASWAEKKGHLLTCTRFWAGDACPDPNDVRMLVVMGGPMGVYDEDEYPWLADEKQFVRAAADHGAGILGICLGAQLLAEVFGGKVYQNQHKEIGWYPVNRSGTVPDWLEDIFPGELNVLHWHGDTFDIPVSGTRFCSSKACRNQGFVIGDRLIGLQFHLEMLEEDLARLIENCRDELIPGTWVQDERTMVSTTSDLMERREILDRLMDYLQAMSENKR